MGAGMINTGRQSMMLSKITTELKTANALIFPAKRLYQRPGVIGAAVIHENDGEIIRNGRERRNETLTKLPQDSLSLVERYDDRNFVRRSVLYQASSGMGLINGEHGLLKFQMNGHGTARLGCFDMSRREARQPIKHSASARVVPIFSRLLSEGFVRRSGHIFASDRCSPQPSPPPIPAIRKRLEKMEHYFPASDKLPSGHAPLL